MASRPVKVSAIGQAKGENKETPRPSGGIDSAPDPGRDEDDREETEEGREDEVEDVVEGREMVADAPGSGANRGTRRT